MMPSPGQRWDLQRLEAEVMRTDQNLHGTARLLAPPGHEPFNQLEGLEADVLETQAWCCYALPFLAATMC